MADGRRPARDVRPLDRSSAGHDHGPAGPATATVADCNNGANGFVDIPDNLSGTVARSADLGNGRTVTLQHGNVAGAQRGWAELSGATQPSDLVWMDWTTNGGTSWLQCGPFSSDQGWGQSKTSAAKATNSSSQYVFRACARSFSPYDLGRCSTWW
ncbi:hypothetical protein [Kitasatospora sp. NPDC004289]